MADLFNVTHDAGNLSEYDSTVTDSGDLSAEVAAALASTSYGLQCVIDDTTAIYGLMNITPTSRYRFRFYVDPNGLTMASGDVFNLCSIHASAAPTTWSVVQLRYDGSNYEIRLNMRSDGGADNFTSNYDISDEQHYIEVDLVRATSAVSNDATGELFIDGVSQETLSGIDAYNVWANIINTRFGAPAGLDAGTSGTFYLDEFKANDDGTLIGPVSVGVPVKTLYYARRRM
jgi:hypothetical protein